MVIYGTLLHIMLIFGNLCSFMVFLVVVFYVYLWHIWLVYGVKVLHGLTLFMFYPTLFRSIGH